MSLTGRGGNKGVSREARSMYTHLRGAGVGQENPITMKRSIVSTKMRKGASYINVKRQNILQSMDGKQRTRHFFFFLLSTKKG